MNTTHPHKQNLHTHSTFCDGKHTPRQIADWAIQLGFDSLGYSLHSYMHFNPRAAAKPNVTADYIAEINRLKTEYEGKLKIFLGLEFDMFSLVDFAPFDYVIGSMHYFHINGEYVGFDRSQEQVQQVIDDHFGGDGMKYAQLYYEKLSDLPKYGKFDILGHFDLICKHSDNARFFDEADPRYLRWATEAAHALRDHIPYFEVNTGAIARGYRKTPYPAIPLTKMLREQGFEPIISSDCHNAPQLDCEFAQAEEHLRACGFTHRHVLTDNGFVPVKL